MSEYQLEITKSAQKQLDKLSNAIAEMLIEAILLLAKNPRPSGCKKLKGRDAYRIRKGNYRIIYEIYDDVLIVEVIGLGHRKEIYE
jgi:mRNA interferase RelE/StbE